MSSKTEKYIERIREGSGEVEEVIEKIRKGKVDELEATRAELEIEKMKMEIRKFQEEGKPVSQNMANDFTGLLFAGRRPEEVKQILDTLEPEHIQKLALITSAMGNNQLGLITQLLNKPDRGIKDTLDLITTIIKLNQPQQSNAVDLKGLAEIFKAGVEAAKAQNQPAPQTQDPMQIYKVVSEMVRPFQDEARAREKEANELRYKELESKIVNPLEYIKNVKAMASDLGMSSAGKTEVDLKLEEMRQNRETDNRKIELEEKKWAYEKQNEGKTLETITGTVKEVLSGPIGKAIENLGSGAADRVRGGSHATGNMVQVQCPSCKGVFAANPNLSLIVCPSCGAKLEKQPPPTPETATPESTPQPEPEPQQPLSNQTVVTNIVDLNKR